MNSYAPNKVTVIGHTHPDTDSVCSAIAYAELKNRLTNSDLYVPRRAGGINAETRFVLNYFKVDVPELVEDVGTQVKDIEIREIDGVAGSISLKKASICSTPGS
jgi:manganese-dependent inorganic pyrophosphatase